MRANVIVGVSIDTEKWISNLKLQNAENIFVINYEYFGEPTSRNGVTYFSSTDAKNQLEKFDSICFYKSMYVYPNMGGKMSSLYKK